MKKLKLDQQKFAGAEVLTRAQLRKVMGGTGSSPKIDACKGKKDGDECIWTYSGTTYSGKCRSYMAQPLACSTLI